MAKRNSTKVKFIVVYVLIALLLVGLCATVITLDKQITTETVSVWAFKNGALDAEGEYDESDGSIYMKNVESVDGLEIEVMEDAEVTYQIFFYDEDKEFLSASEELSADYVYANDVEGAEYFRVVITPTDDEEIGLFEKNGYAKQLTITIDRA